MSIIQGSLASRFYFCFGECVHNCWKSAFHTCVPVVGECVHNCLNFAIQICAVLVGKCVFTCWDLPSECFVAGWLSRWARLHGRA